MLLDARLVTASAADPELAAAFAQAEALTRANSKTFYTATGLLPAEARRAIRAL